MGEDSRRRWYTRLEARLLLLLLLVRTPPPPPKSCLASEQYIVRRFIEGFVSLGRRKGGGLSSMRRVETPRTLTERTTLAAAERRTMETSKRTKTIPRRHQT